MSVSWNAAYIGRVAKCTAAPYGAARRRTVSYGAASGVKEPSVSVLADDDDACRLWLAGRDQSWQWVEMGRMGHQFWMGNMQGRSQEFHLGGINFN